jgi:hypothetical protein
MTHTYFNMKIYTGRMTQQEPAEGGGCEGLPNKGMVSEVCMCLCVCVCVCMRCIYGVNDIHMLFSVCWPTQYRHGVHIYIYIYMHIYVSFPHTHTHTHTHTHIHTYTYTHTHKNTQPHSQRGVSLLVWLVIAHDLTYTDPETHIHTHTHTHTHKYTSTQPERCAIADLVGYNT